MLTENSESNSGIMHEIAKSRKWVVCIRILLKLSCSAVTNITMITEGYIDFGDRCWRTELEILNNKKSNQHHDSVTNFFKLSSSLSHKHNTVTNITVTYQMSTISYGPKRNLYSSLQPSSHFYRSNFCS